MLDGELGQVWNVHGMYVQDWLQQDDRLELAPRSGGSGGALRAVADIGTHWLDLTGWITVAGSRACSPTSTPCIRYAACRPAPSRHTPDAGAVERVDRPMTTEDVAHVLVRYDGRRARAGDDLAGQRGTQEPPLFELDGSEGALAWSSERHEELWLGHRNRPNELLFATPR